MASARRILAVDRLTADGYSAGADGNLSWVVPDDEPVKAATGTSRDNDRESASRVA